MSESTTVAVEAQALVYGDRQDTYGRVLDDFGRTAALWTAVFADKLLPGASFEPEDVATALRMVKESRLRNSPRHRDSLVDIVGYALTQERCWADREQLAHEADVLVETLHAVPVTTTVPA